MNDQQMTEPKTAAPLMPVWTEDDFYSDAVYEWLWDRRQENPYRFQMMLGLTQKRARELHINGFMKTWNEFVKVNTQRTPTVMGANMTGFPDQPMQMESREYVCDADGVSYTGRDGGKVDVISHPLLPVKRIINIDTFEEKVQIAYWRSEAEGWKTMIVGSEVISSAQRIIALARNGISVNSENAKEVVRYLSSLRDWNYRELAVQKSASHLGWLPDGQFAPFAKEIEYDGESDEFARLYGGFRPEGDENVWLETVRKVRSGKSVPARIALAASFAAPLVSKLGALSFFVHLWGLQGSGKTVALLLGASVWGNPQIGGYIKSFSGTKVSMELFSAFCGNLPVFLDELQVISDRKSFDDIIYSLCEGVSKGRGAKDGGLQTSRRWATVFLTTGEMPIVQSNSGGGAAVRTIEVNYGGEPFFEDARGTANVLKTNYGFAGRKFIEALREEGTLDALKEIQKDYYGKLAGDIQDKQVLSASLLLAADKLADIAVFRDGKALTVEEIKPYLITQEQADQNQRAYNYVVEWVAKNRKQFCEDPEGNNREVWGIIKEDKGTKKEVAYIIKSVLEDGMREGGFVSCNAFLSWAKRKGFLITSPSTPQRNTVQRSIGASKGVTCVAIRLPDDPGDDFTVVDDEPLPFMD